MGPRHQVDGVPHPRAEHLDGRGVGHAVGSRPEHGEQLRE